MRIDKVNDELKPQGSLSFGLVSFQKVGFNLFLLEILQLFGAGLELEFCI